MFIELVESGCPDAHLMPSSFQRNLFSFWKLVYLLLKHCFMQQLKTHACSKASILSLCSATHAMCMRGEALHFFLLSRIRRTASVTLLIWLAVFRGRLSRISEVVSLNVIWSSSSVSRSCSFRVLSFLGFNYCYSVLQDSCLNFKFSFDFWL